MADRANPSGGYNGTAEPVTVVLFGASGDLAKRKVIPAMYDLATHKALGSRYAIVGFSRTAMTDESFRSTIGEAAKTISEVGPIDPTQWNEFAGNLYYSQGDYGKPESFAALAKRLGMAHRFAHLLARADAHQRIFDAEEMFAGNDQP